ncbi:60S ribosomal protein L27 [Sphaeroforma arctica JP610]|uniref:60S ribosomal protein L27 n=1 Tax=Sphaeroforma arctica JP610 TaxID=667725 RepID=A0A0L0G8V1_9EUKA|nr:60S ribosomal protein L27 [Sphaeroforma arctica JP610]KNC84658.1 60S ribosomal protein L27 [Sphaeroforma arctica JP610]|eukprot:XP_014158560.1 60S ribosomal protein L27 [Sphaeroforma arctica JP610]
MPRFMKSGKVVIVLGGRYAGKKAVIVSNHDNGDKERKYGYAVVAGVSKYPLKIGKGMGQKKISKRSKVKPFVKIVNYNHLMPTRYTLDVALDGVVSKEIVKDAAQRSAARKNVRKVLEERYKTGKNKWFFEKLRF